MEFRFEVLSKNVDLRMDSAIAGHCCSQKSVGVCLFSEERRIATYRCGSNCPIAEASRLAVMRAAEKDGYCFDGKNGKFCGGTDSTTRTKTSLHIIGRYLGGKTDGQTTIEFTLKNGLFSLRRGMGK